MNTAANSAAMRVAGAELNTTGAAAAPAFEDDLFIAYERYPNAYAEAPGVSVRESWNTFTQRLARPIVVTIEDTWLSDVAKLDAEKLRLPLLRFVSGGGETPSRAKGHQTPISAVNALVLDCDGGHDRIEMQAAFADFQHCGYTTFKHTVDGQRIRLVVPLSKPLPPEDYSPWADRVMAYLGAGFDTTAAQYKRAFFAPGVPSLLESEYAYWVQPGVLLNPDEWPPRFAGDGPDGFGTNIPQEASMRSASVSLVESEIKKGQRNSDLLSMAAQLRHRGFPQSTIEVLLQDINTSRCRPPLRAEEVLDIARRYAKPEDSPDEWPPVKPIPNTLPKVIPFDPNAMLPASLASWVEDVADRMQCPPDYLGVAVMAVCGSLIGARLGVRPKCIDDWYEVPNIWGLIVGASGDKKTPALSEMLSGLRKLQEGANVQYSQKLLLHHFDLTMHAQDLATKKQNHKKGQYTLVAGDLQAPVPPPERRYLVHDTTVEALGVILADNPNGVLCYADELIGLLSRLDGEERRADRAFYLAAYNGKDGYTVDRITRDRVLIQRLCVSILGSTQPDAIKQYLRQAVHGGVGNDGLVQRFQLAVYPDRQRGSVKIVDRAPDASARDQAQKSFEYLNTLDPIAVSAQTGGPIPTLGFDAQAQPVVRQWLQEIETVMQHSEAHPALISHYSKYRKTIPTLALIIHLAEGSVGDINLQAFTKALAWQEYLRSHAKRIYASVTKGHFDDARVLANRIERGKLQDGFTARDVLHKDWAQLGSSQQVGHAIDVLIEYGWLRPERHEGSGRPTVHYRIHPHKRKEA